MNEYQARLSELLAEEEALQFTEFGSGTALAVGMAILERARREGKAVTIDVTRNGHQLFHYAFDGTSPDNDQWVLGKNRVVNRFGRSSLYIGTLLKNLGKTIREKYYLDPAEYRAHGGAFPVRVRNVGVVGTITVSGLTQEEDHEMVTSAVREYLGR